MSQNSKLFVMVIGDPFDRKRWLFCDSFCFFVVSDAMAIYIIIMDCNCKKGFGIAVCVALLGE